jgi:4-amino-4-deoxy-L-arabinose transferase-like glycosyltransferase
LLKAFVSVALIETICALLAVTAIPSDSKNALLLGFSASRLALMAGLTFLLIISAGILAWISTAPARMERAIYFTNGFLLNIKKRSLLVLFCGMAAVVGMLFLLIPAKQVGEAVYQRLFPVVWLAILLALQTLVLQFIWQGRRVDWGQLTSSKKVLIAGGGTLTFFIAAWIYIAWSGLGIKPESSGWLTPGTPILAQQVLFAWLIGVGFIAFEKQLDRYKKSDLVIAIVIWVVAGLVWWLEPMRRWGYFTPAPTPPNFEYYPHSDAALYDGFAQTILIGASRQIDFTARPLYTIFIALLHALFGQKFEILAVAQVFVLAITPAFVYLLARKLGGRAAGVLAAVLLIFREKNSIAVTNIIEVSHSKLFMADLPTMTMLVIFIFFLVWWLQDKKNRLFLGVFAGAFLGLAILIRSQAQLMIPIVLLGIIAARWDGWKPVMQRLLVFTLGLLVVVAPWVWRNYQVSGRAVVEYHEAYTYFFAVSYVDPPDALQMLPNETVDEYDGRVMSLVIRSILDNPQSVLRDWFSYFIHNEILSVTYLPMNPQFNGLYSYIEKMGFWDSPGEQLPAQVLPIFFFTLFLIALGLGTAFDRVGIMAFMPLLLHFLYNFSVTFVHISGWRFILPVDWVAALYFGIGLVQASIMLFSLFSQKHTTPSPLQFEYAPILWKYTPIALIFFAILGASFPLFEASFPQRYPAMRPGALIEKYMPAQAVTVDGVTVSASEVSSFLEMEPDAVVVDGRALYPAYYPQGSYWGDAPYLTEAKQYDRLGFSLIGGTRGNVFIPVENAPKYFPHASDVFVAGCHTPAGAIRALVIKVNDTFITTSPWRGLTCSLP